jgi:hypothetical protein
MQQVSDDDEFDKLFDLDEAAMLEIDEKERVILTQW